MINDTPVEWEPFEDVIRDLSSPAMNSLRGGDVRIRMDERLGR
jgi:hypothetical protein